MQLQLYYMKIWSQYCRIIFPQKEIWKSKFSCKISRFLQTKDTSVGQIQLMDLYLAQNTDLKHLFKKDFLTLQTWRRFPGKKKTGVKGTTEWRDTVFTREQSQCASHVLSTDSGRQEDHTELDG